MKQQGIKAPRRAATLLAIAVAALGASAGPAGAHRAPSGVSEATLRAFERATLGPEHAAEHAAERRSLRHARAVWLRRPASERRRLRARAARTARRAQAAVTTPADQVGRWEAHRIPFPTYAINVVMLPTGRVMFWGRSPLNKTTQTRVNDTPAYIWDPAKGASGFTAIRPPKIVIDGKTVEAPLFCSGQSLLPSGEVFAAGGTLAYPVYNSSGDTVTDFKGLNRTFTFDPWTLKWTVQPAMRKGRWYPSQVELADGRIAVLAGWDESGATHPNSDNPDFEVFTPSAVRGGAGTMTHYVTGDRPNTWYYPHLFTMPDGRLLLGGSEPGESGLLDPAKLSTSAGPSAWTDLPDLSAQYRYSASAVLLPAGPSGSSRVAILGGLTPDGTAARRDSDVIDTRATSPAWQRNDAVVPQLNEGRDYFNVVLLPDGTLASVGGASGKTEPAKPGFPAPLNSSTNGKQELKRIELLRPGSHSWTLGPPELKWRTYHSSAVLLPDGRILSAGDDYWDFADEPDPYIRQGPTASKPLDEAEIYEPPYLFDGDQPAPRPTILGGPASAAWGDDAGIPVREVAGRPATRAVLVAPSAVTHGVDMNQRHIELSVLGRVPGKGLNVRLPASPQIAPPGWYMLFVLDSTGTPSVAHWVQLRAGAPDAPTLSPDAAPTGSPSPTATPPTADTRAPRASVRARNLRRGARSVRLVVSANEAARVTLTVRIGARRVRLRVTLTAARRSRTITLRLRPSERRRLARTHRLRLRVALAARDASGNLAHRTIRLRLKSPG